MQLLLLLGFVLVWVYGFWSIWSRPKDQFIFFYFACLFLLAIFVAMRGVDYDLDSVVYKSIFDEIDIENFTYWLLNGPVEPAFVLISGGSKFLGFNYTAVSLLFLFLSFFGYFYSYRRFRWQGFFIAFAFYFSTGFLVREFTQIRFGLSVAFGLMALLEFISGRYFRFLLWFIISVSAHSAGYFILVYAVALWIFSKFSLPSFISAAAFFCAGYFLFFNGYVQDYLFSLPRISRYSDTDEFSFAISWGVQCLMFLVLTFFMTRKHVEFFPYFVIATVTFFLLLAFWDVRILQRSTVYGFMFLGVALAELLKKGTPFKLFIALLFISYFPLSFITKLNQLVL